VSDVSVQEEQTGSLQQDA